MTTDYLITMWQSELNASRAEAWDEGYQANTDNRRNARATTPYHPTYTPELNPYRDGTALPRVEVGVPVVELEALAAEWERPVDGRQEYAALAFLCAADELRALTARALGHGGEG